MVAGHNAIEDSLSLRHVLESARRRSLHADDHANKMPSKPNGGLAPAGEERRGAKTLSLARWTNDVKRTFRDARLAPDGGTLWVLDTGSATLSGFAVSSGSLAELPSSPIPLPAGATAFGIVVN
jgi:hypothetical protein